MRRSTLLVLSFLSFGALLPAACTQDFDIFGPSGGTGATGGTASSSSSSTSTSSSSSGNTGCMADMECDDQNPCTTDTCNKTTGMCVNADIDGNVPDYVDTVKDCQTAKCVAGVQKTVPLDTDVPDNSNPCVTVTCSNGMPQTANVTDGTSCGPGQQKCTGGVCMGCMKDQDCPSPSACETRACTNMQCVYTPKSAGTTCSSGGGTVCNDAGMCVPCIADGDCNGPPEICTNNQCTSSCGDGTKNGAETDKDCGAACPTCANGKMCKVATDCTSKVCTSLVCQTPTCTDTVQNGNETDKDCGGGACPACGDGKKCGADGDCTSGHCINNTCATQCADMVKDGTETDVDCGGSCTTKCATGKGCAVNGDCTSGSCNTSTMQCVATPCSNGVKDGTETDVDCGGSCPANCADGKGCANSNDCTSGFCNTTTMLCATPSCTDMFKNGTETDVDCGGTCTTKCGDGKVCGADTDCMSAHCAGNVCLPATCFDLTKDGTETDIDCGGGTCLKCGQNKSCTTGSDCQSGTCKANNTCM